MDIREFWQRYEFGHRNFRGVCLTGSQFEMDEINDIDLGEANLEDSTFSKCIFRNSNLSRVNLRGASFYESSFFNVNLQQANLNEITAIDLTFQRCNLSQLNITNANLGDVYFLETDLQKSKWHGTSWCGLLAESNLTEASLDGLITSKVELMRTILPNGSLGNQIWNDLVIQGEFSTQLNLLSQSLDLSVNPISGIEVNYTKLRSFLIAHQWIAADRETCYLVCKIATGEFPSIIMDEEMLGFPCSDLQTLDQLWMHYSRGKFGFSAQYRIWKSLNKVGNFELGFYEQLRTCLGWKINHEDTITSCVDEKSMELIPEGYFPLIAKWPAVYGAGILEIESLYYRIQHCKNEDC